MKEQKTHYKYEFILLNHKVNDYYLCNWAVKIDNNKVTFELNKVTCKNCLRIIKNWKLENKILKEFENGKQ